MRAKSFLITSCCALTLLSSSLINPALAEETDVAATASTDNTAVVSTPAGTPEAGATAEAPRPAPKPRVARAPEAAPASAASTAAAGTAAASPAADNKPIEKVEQTNKYVARNSVTGAELPPNTQGGYIDPNAPKADNNGYYPGATVYVSDKNRIWTRSGPSEGYRVTGSRQIGDALKFVKYSDNGRYAQLESDGETFWMPLASIQPQITGYPLEAQLRKQIADLQYRLDNYDSELSNRLKVAETELAKTTKENSELKHTLTNKEATIEELDTLYREYADRLETKELDMQMRWWTQGALIAFCGAIAGVIFVFIPRPSRPKKRERY